MPTILEPSHKVRESQNIYIIAGVPFPDKNRNAVDKVVRIEATIATSFLNHRFRRRIMKNAVNIAIMTDGNLIDQILRPKK